MLSAKKSSRSSKMWRISSSPHANPQALYSEDTPMRNRRRQPVIFLSVLTTLVFVAASSLQGQQKTRQMPPAVVAVAAVTTGMLAPVSEFIATVFYREISDTAAEVAGLAETVEFEEGQRVKKGQVLVKLSSDLLRKRLLAAKASYEQVLSELEISRIDLKRRKILFAKKSVSAQAFDEVRFRVAGLEKRAAAVQAQAQQLEIELLKKKIRAPFDGIVIKRQVDRGEWVAKGQTVAVIGKDDVIDIVAEIPQRYIDYVKAGMAVKVEANRRRFEATVVTVIPRGDVATRTIPVKIRAANHYGLIEGMSARVTLPTGDRRSALIVPRDAIVSVFGKNAVFAVVNAKARTMPVRIVGYDGLTAGIQAEGLKAGMQVVVKGNERLRDGQSVVAGPTANSGQGSARP